MAPRCEKVRRKWFMRTHCYRVDAKSWKNSFLDLPKLYAHEVADAATAGSMCKYWLAAAN
jgi:hypothetical protein